MRRAALALACGVLAGCAHAPRALLRPALADTASPASAHRLLVFNEAMSANGSAPSFVTLDSGVVYRLYIDGDAQVSLSARDQSRPAPRRAMILFGEQAVLWSTARIVQASDTRPAFYAAEVPLSHRTGIPFEAPATGEYRVATEPGTNSLVLVRIFREEADNLSALCVADPSAYGCRGASDPASRPQGRLGMVGVIGAFLVPLAAWALGPR